MIKRYSLIAIAFVAGSSWSLAQGQSTVPCAPNGILTDPPAATNQQVPSKRNSFIWAPSASQPNYPINWRVNTLRPYIEAPYYQNNNVSTEIAQLQGAPDIASSGWELIKKADGYIEGPNPVPDQVGVDNPYVILYNKYTSVMRVFWSVGRVAPPANFCTIEISFIGSNDNTRSKSGLLNRISGIGVPLEETPVGASNTLFALKSFPTADNAWFMADFPMDYDPCSCIQQSTLHFAIKLINKADVKLSSESSGTLASINNGGGSLSPSSGRTVFGGIVNGANTAVNGVTSSFNNGYSFRDNLYNLGNVSQDTRNAGNTFAQALTSSNFAKQALTAIPYVGAALSVLDFFFGGASDGGPQAVSVQPMAISFSTQTSGSVTTTYEHTGATLAVPGGAYRPSSPQLYPAYNEVLGLFNLLKRPAFSVINSGYDNAYYYNTYDQYGNPSYVGPGGYIGHTYLLNDLPYVLNPASGLRIKEMQASLMITGELDIRNYNYSSQQAVDAVAQGSLGDFRQVVKNYGTMGTFGPVVDVVTPWVDAGCLKGQYFTLNDAAYPRQPDPAVDPTTFPVTAANNAPIALNGRPIYLKLLITLERITPCATCQNTVLLVTYPINETVLTSATPGSNPGVSDPYPHDDISLYGTLPPCGAIPDPVTSAAIADFCQRNPSYSAATQLRGTGVATVPSRGTMTHADNQTLTQFACYPNPVSAKATIEFAVTNNEAVKVQIFNALGKLTRTVSDAPYAAGLYKLDFDATDFPAGVYHCVLLTPSKRETLKIVVVK